MYLQFLSYFISYLFGSHTRQKLLYFAMAGLFLSAFALLVVQSIMGGFQKNLKLRSKEASGEAVIFISDYDPHFLRPLLAQLEAIDITSYPEYEIELLVRYQDEVAPVILHGIDKKKKAPFLEKSDISHVVLGTDLAYALRTDAESILHFFSPSHTVEFLEDIPLQVSSSVSDTIQTDVAELDRYHAWVRLELVQNLIQNKSINRLRLYHLQGKEKKLQKILEMFPQVELKTWEDLNPSLAWALALETKTMLFLFLCMSILVAIAVTSGFLIFFDKIKLDLVSFWVLGISQKRIQILTSLFLHLLAIATILAGVFTALLFLFFLDKYAPDLMPHIFVDRRIPVSINFSSLLTSFLVPYAVAIFFSHFALKAFRKDSPSFLELLRENCH